MRTHSACTSAQPAPDRTYATASRIARSESKRSLPSQWTIFTFRNPEKLSEANGVRGLVALRNGDAVAVVLHDEDDGQLLARGAVDGLVEVALGRRRLALRAEDDRVRPVRLHGAAEARGVLGVVRDAGRDVLDVDLGLREVVRHVPPAGGDVVPLRHPVQQDLLGRQAAGEARREVAVVREEIVDAGDGT